MSHAILELEDFDTQPRLAPEAVGAATEALEEARSLGYAAGYATGWDDAIASQAQDQTLIREEFARSLRDLSFTYFEARAHVQASAIGLMRAFIDALFPRFIGATAQQLISDHIETLTAEVADTPIIVRVAPSEADTLEALMDGATVPFVVTPEPSLSSGQILLKIGPAETSFDLSGMIEAVQSALDALETETTRALNHG